MEEQSPSAAKASSATGSDCVRAEAPTLQRLRSVVSGVVVDRVRSYFCSPVRDGDYGQWGLWPIQEKRSLGSPNVFRPRCSGANLGKARPSSACFICVENR